VVDDTDIEKLLRAADTVEETYSRNCRRASSITPVVEPPVKNASTSDPVAAAINGLNERFSQM
jgi:hypothetical protein